jgi:hypothetical protein
VTELSRVERAVLSAPAVVARPLAAVTRDPEQRWMLSQPRTVRTSYLRDVIDGPPIARLEEFWMIRQPPEVRMSYIRKVLNNGH